MSLRLCEDCGVVPEGVFPLRLAKQVEQAPGDITDARFVSCVFHFDMLTLNGSVTQDLTEHKFSQGLTDDSVSGKACRVLPSD